MQTYITFLRGINVGGKNSIKMQELKSVMLASGFYNVQTYIQSGNITFEYENINPEKISEKIANLIQEKFNLNIAVLTYFPTDLQKIYETNPFLNSSNDDSNSLYITFFAEKYEKQNQQKIAEIQTEDSYEITEKCLYLKCANKYSDTKISNQFIEKKLKINATTRKIDTIKKMIILAKK